MKSTKRHLFSTIVVAGTNGYDIHLDIDTEGNGAMRVRSYATGKSHVQVLLDQQTTAAMAVQLQSTVDAAAALRGIHPAETRLRAVEAS
jgi:hypothetical protein